MSQSPFDPSTASTVASPAVTTWRRRAANLFITALAIILPSYLLAAALSAGSGHELDTFVRVVCGPFSSLFAEQHSLSQYTGDFAFLTSMTLAVLAYAVYPSCMTGVLTTVGVLYWLMYGWVAATGGV